MAFEGEAPARLSFFGEVDERCLHEIAPHVMERHFSCGQVLVLEDDSYRTSHSLARGVARIPRISLGGR